MSSKIFEYLLANIEHSLIFDYFQANIEPNDSAQSFTLMNSFWFILASLLGQGVDLLPR